MYCSSCGGAVAQGLTFCNQCGSRLNLARRDEISKSREITPEPLVWAIVSVFLGGTGVIIGLLAVMKNVLHFELGILMFFSMLTFLMMTVIEAVFIWKLIGRRGAQVVEPAQLRPNATGELDGVQPRTFAEPVHSVTDGTTRSFEPILTKRTSE